MKKIRNVEANRLRDLAACAYQLLLIEDCPGGRPINQGCICPHCGMDTSYGDCGGVEGFMKTERAA